MFCDLAEDIFGYVREMNALREKVRADSWAGLSSEYFRWSRARRAAATPENPGPTWECLLVQVERDGVRAVALRNLYELAEEGERMQNSAHEYAGRCSRGLSRVFSIWSGGQRAGMGEIVPDGAGARAWRVAQVYGPRNSRPSPEAEAVMELAAREYGGAERRAGPRGEEEREERRA